MQAGRVLSVANALGYDRKAAERAAPEVVGFFHRRIDEAKANAKLAAATPH